MNQSAIGSKLIAAGAVVVAVAGGATAAVGGPSHHKKPAAKAPTVYIAQYDELGGGKQPPIGHQSGTYLTLPAGKYLMHYDISALSTDTGNDALNCDPVYSDKGLGGGGLTIDLYTHDGGSGQAITGASASSTEVWHAKSTTKVSIDCSPVGVAPGLSISEFTVTATPIGTLHASGAAAS